MAVLVSLQMPDENLTSKVLNLLSFCYTMKLSEVEPIYHIWFQLVILMLMFGLGTGLGHGFPSRVRIDTICFSRDLEKNDLLGGILSP